MKCPKCKKEVKKVYIRQEFSAFTLGTMDEQGKKEFGDLEAGYSQLGDWLDNMLMEKGRPKITGCENCI